VVVVMILLLSWRQANFTTFVVCQILRYDSAP